MQSKNHMNYCSTIFVGQKVADKICCLVAVLSIALGMLVKRRGLRCIGFLQIRKEGIYGFDHQGQRTGNLINIQESAMLTLYQVSKQVLFYTCS